MQTHHKKPDILCFQILIIHKCIIMFLIRYKRKTVLNDIVWFLTKNMLYITQMVWLLSNIKQNIGKIKIIYSCMHSTQHFIASHILLTESYNKCRLISFFEAHTIVYKILRTVVFCRIKGALCV